jgi:hypothetical protein
LGFYSALFIYSKIFKVEEVVLLGKFFYFYAFIMLLNDLEVYLEKDDVSYLEQAEPDCFEN